MNTSQWSDEEQLKRNESFIKHYNENPQNHRLCDKEAVERAINENHQLRVKLALTGAARDE